MVTVNIPYPDAFDGAFRKFKRMCDKAGIIARCRDKQFCEKPKEVRKRKKILAIRRTLRQKLLSR